MLWGRIFRIGGGIGIVLALVPVAATILGSLSEFRYRHIDQTANLLIGLDPNIAYRREAEIMALEYNSKKIYIPLCRFKGCLIRRQIDVRDIHLYHKDANDEDRGPKLEDLDLSEGRVFQSDFREAKIVNSNLSLIQWSEVNLKLSEFGNTRLRCAQIVDSDLRNATFRDSDLRGARFFGSNIGNAVISTENPSSMGIDENTFRGAWIWEGEHPDGLENHPNLQTYDICKRNGDSSDDAALAIKPDNCGGLDNVVVECPAMSFAEQYSNPLKEFFGIE